MYSVIKDGKCVYTGSKTSACIKAEQVEADAVIPVDFRTPQPQETEEMYAYQQKRAY